jgi:hypothetical protein
MERFLAETEDAALRTELAAALRSRAVFRSFREVVSRDERILQRWRTFRRAQTLAHARIWLEANQLMVPRVHATSIPEESAALTMARLRGRLHSASAGLPVSDLVALVRLAEFLHHCAVLRCAGAGRVAVASCDAGANRGVESPGDFG